MKSRTRRSRKSATHDRLASVLAAEECDGFPRGFTHYELAQRLYAVATPTPSQLSVVRRAVARLVAERRAERNRDRWDGSTGLHGRVRYATGEPYACRNPSGVRIHRPTTEADRAKARGRLAELERVIAGAA